MKSRIARVMRVVPLVVIVSSCSSSNPLTPSVTTPNLLQPANGAQISNLSQPVTLVVANSITTGTGTLTYTFEVATDTAFANKVFTNTSVPQGGNGQTSVLLGTLNAGSNYYWHARAGATGAFSAPFKFTIGPAISLSAPTPVAPSNGATTSGWPTFTVNDATKTGPASPLVYRFDIGTS